MHTHNKTSGLPTTKYKTVINPDLQKANQSICKPTIGSASWMVSDKLDQQCVVLDFPEGVSAPEGSKLVLVNKNLAHTELPPTDSDPQRAKILNEEYEQIAVIDFPSEAMRPGSLFFIDAKELLKAGIVSGDTVALKLVSPTMSSEETEVTFPKLTNAEADRTPFSLPPETEAPRYGAKELARSIHNDRLSHHAPCERVPGLPSEVEIKKYSNYSEKLEATLKNLELFVKVIMHLGNEATGEVQQEAKTNHRGEVNFVLQKPVKFGEYVWFSLAHADQVTHYPDVLTVREGKLDSISYDDEKFQKVMTENRWTRDEENVVEDKYSISASTQPRKEDVDT